MTENTFFDDWTNRKVDFHRGPGSMWTLEKLYSEKNSQVDDERFYEYRCIGGAYGTFLCHNVMDIPYDGSQRAPAEHRKAQAQSIPVDDFNIDSQLNALSTLTTKHCESSPIILDIEFSTQLATDPVPGGYIYFVLTNYLPGIKLSKIIFWILKTSESEQIRQAFNLAWKDCVNPGIVPRLQEIEHVLWDAAAKNAMSEPAAESDEWRDAEWIVWGRAKTQNNRICLEDPNKHPDMSM
ncbi:hypothetical protein AARAC_010544 [Aspergillus arachidicola]|uniref:Uncharacterized protein n=1 Tax=Aspergillus arachidicola TaxID=656916 RepID=A0A2G7FVW8_9EURO|nr:hypothetical protein AARAC_010544 [Aspergillus arachidicola]